MTDIVDLLRNGWTTVPQVLAAANEIERLNRELDSLRAERDALREDAERYRWLRDSAKSASVIPRIWFAPPGLMDAEVDAAIDAARKGER